MVEVLTNLGDRLTKSEARKLVANADVTGDGRIDYKGRPKYIVRIMTSQLHYIHWYL